MIVGYVGMRVGMGSHHHTTVTTVTVRDIAPQTNQEWTTIATRPMPLSIAAMTMATFEEVPIPSL